MKLNAASKTAKKTSGSGSAILNFTLLLLVFIGKPKLKKMGMQVLGYDMDDILAFLKRHQFTIL